MSMRGGAKMKGRSLPIVAIGRASAPGAKDATRALLAAGSAGRDSQAKAGAKAIRKSGRRAEPLEAERSAASAIAARAIALDALRAESGIRAIESIAQA